MGVHVSLHVNDNNSTLALDFFIGEVENVTWNTQSQSHLLLARKAALEKLLT